MFCTVQNMCMIYTISDGTKKTRKSTYSETDQVGREKLFSYTHSEGFHNYAGLGWAFVISHDAKEVFAPVRVLRNVLFGVFGVLILVIGVLAVILSRAISRPIKKLTETVRDIAGGDLKKRADVKSKDEIGQLGNAFNDMTGKLQDSYDKLKRQVEELKTLDLLKDDFLNNTTHELKTPLVPIKSQAQLLLAEDYGPLNADQKKAIVMIARNEPHLEGLVSDVVDITKIRSGKLKLVLENAAFIPLIKEAVEDMQELAKERGVVLNFAPIPELPPLSLDAKRITQVIYNLLANALKFTPEGGTVTVEVAHDASSITATVTDTGIGMSEKTLKKLFTPFFQADSDAARKYAGTGLGLSISKGIIEAHGGSIKAESDGEGKGSALSFTLPITKN